ncbi:MAG: hypothetical protein GX964_07450 [Syntrophomonadaceae bacterium]|jgi:RNA polymerase subunit RPABC4/transcription elongation factor Spt4|nr:hypothetical protein [Syntrophomonadaceae bacterium]
MHCPLCKHPLEKDNPCCPNCGHNPRAGFTDWSLLKIVYPPEDMLLKGLLASCGIPVRLVREAIGPVQGLTLGPLAEVKILVPPDRLEEARYLLNSPPAEP